MMQCQTAAVMHMIEDKAALRILTTLEGSRVRQSARLTDSLRWRVSDRSASIRCFRIALPQQNSIPFPHDSTRYSIQPNVRSAPKDCMHPDKTLGSTAQNPGTPRENGVVVGTPSGTFPTMPLQMPVK